MLLQLLVDDNADVRREASKLICRIEPRDELECIERMLSVFFRKFDEIVADRCPEVAIGALFCWSVSLLGDADYEMDETDVSELTVKFNRRRSSHSLRYIKFNNIDLFYRCSTNVGITISSNP